jgi:hypothetical protein
MMAHRLTYIVTLRITIATTRQAIKPYSMTELRDPSGIERENMSIAGSPFCVWLRFSAAAEHA